MNKTPFFVTIITILLTVNSFATNVFFDNTHSQSSGNSDWSIKGGYSDLADLLKKNDFNVIDEEIDLSEIPEDIDIIVIPEPNDPFSKDEIKAIVEFTKTGGSLLLIGNHSGADRNGNGYDAVRSFNEFVFHFGFMYNSGHSTDIPLKMTDHPICRDVNVIGSFAGTTINPVLSTVKPVVMTENKSPFMVESQVDKGTVLALCDTAIFDDGTGTEGKHLHNVFNSVMYSNRQFALNVFNYLADRKHKKIKTEKPYDRISEGMITIDIAHANVGADTTEDFCRYLKKWGYTPYYNRERFNSDIVKNSSLIIIYEPGIDLTEEEIRLLENDDTSVLFVAVSSYNSLNRGHLNDVLQRLSHERIITNHDQVLDEKNAIDGSPWTFKADGKTGNVIVFSSCSIKADKKCDILLSSSRHSYSTMNPKEKKPQTLIAFDRDSKTGATGFHLFSNYNFRDSLYYADSYKKVLHNTENFIKYLQNQIRSK